MDELLSISLNLDVGVIKCLEIPTIFRLALTCKKYFNFIINNSFIFKVLLKRLLFSNIFNNSNDFSWISSSYWNKCSEFHAPMLLCLLNLKLKISTSNVKSCVEIDDKLNYIQYRNKKIISKLQQASPIVDLKRDILPKLALSSNDSLLTCKCMKFMKKLKGDEVLFKDPYNRREISFVNIDSVKDEFCLKILVDNNKYTLCNSLFLDDVALSTLNIAQMGLFSQLMFIKGYRSYNLQMLKFDPRFLMCKSHKRFNTFESYITKNIKKYLSIYSITETTCFNMSGKETEIPKTIKDEISNGSIMLKVKFCRGTLERPISINCGKLFKSFLFHRDKELSKGKTKFYIDKEYFKNINLYFRTPTFERITIFKVQNCCNFTLELCDKQYSNLYEKKFFRLTLIKFIETQKEWGRNKQMDISYIHVGFIDCFGKRFYPMKYYCKHEEDVLKILKILSHCSSNTKFVNNILELQSLSSACITCGADIKKKCKNYSCKQSMNLLQTIYGSKLVEKFITKKRKLNNKKDKNDDLSIKRRRKL